MAKSGAVWGIDMGSCALKALRCRPHEKDDNRLVVEAFDYIEYPKILTQPEANREELIQEALRTLLAGRTAIVIAHRLSTIQHVDEILVMHKGTIRERGTHAQLLRAQGLYWRLYQLQYKDQEAGAPASLA